MGRKKRQVIQNSDEMKRMLMAMRQGIATLFFFCLGKDGEVGLRVRRISPRRYIVAQ